MKSIFLTVIILISFSSLQVFSNTNNEEAIADVSIKAQKLSINVTNVAPGDYVTQTITVQNERADELIYNIKNTPAWFGGSNEFYKQLLLKIEDLKGEGQDRILYEGKLDQFDTLAPRLLKNLEKEELFFTIKVPEELGNEFQGAYTSFAMKLYDESTIASFLPVNSNMQINTFNILASTSLFGIGVLSYLFRKKKLQLKQNKLDLD